MKGFEFMAVRRINEDLNKDVYANFLKQLRIIEEALTEVSNITEDYELNDEEHEDLFKAIDTFEYLIANIQSNASES